jgi:triphosphoribosyl-dephospho-CoA synthase
MPETTHVYHRQDLLKLRPDAEISCQESDTAAIRNWLAEGFPVIVRRPGTTGEGIHCGIPLPFAAGLRRLPFCVGQAAVLKRLPLPRLQDCLTALPPGCCPISEKLLLLNPQVFGSVAWQYLTGQEYVHDKSDLDLLVRVSNPIELRRLLTELASLVTPYCDFEIMLWNYRAFSWREWNSGASALLLKSDQQVFLSPRRLLSGELPDFCSIAAAACDALCEELEAYPKPGLVSYIDQGSHDDMDAALFNAAIEALAEFFCELAAVGAQQGDFAILQKLGLAAEAKMLAATAGVNTHRGAIFSLGLLCAAAGRKFAIGSSLSLGEIVSQCWGTDILRRRNPGSHGDAVRRKHGVGGVLAEAAAGFPSLYLHALPALCSLPERNAARMQAFFALLKTLDDTTLLHRGGEEAKDFAARAATEFLRGGGAGRQGWEEQAGRLHQEFVRRQWSCGGVADLLAATIFVQRMENLWQA